MEAALDAGAALFNEGYHHAAHDAWEDRWLGLANGSADERFLHGLIQYTAAVYHAKRRNWEGAIGLAESATGYLHGLAKCHRGVDLAVIRTYLESLAVDPVTIERRTPPPIRIDGRVVTFEELEFEGVAIAAGILAEELTSYEPALIERAIEMAASAEDERYNALLRDFLLVEDRRELIYDRLRAHLERDQTRYSDPAGLFDTDQSS